MSETNSVKALKGNDLKFLRNAGKQFREIIIANGGSEIQITDDHHEPVGPILRRDI